MTSSSLSKGKREGSRVMRMTERGKERTNRCKEAVESCVFGTYVRAGTYPLKRKLAGYKSGVPSSIANIDLNHKDRPRNVVLSGPDLLYSFSCLLRAGALDPLFFSFPSSFLFSTLPSSLFLSLYFPGDDQSIHLFHAVYVPLVACRESTVPAGHGPENRDGIVLWSHNVVHFPAPTFCHVINVHPIPLFDTIIFAKFTENLPLSLLIDCRSAKWACPQRFTDASIVPIYYNILSKLSWDYRSRSMAYLWMIDAIITCDIQRNLQTVLAWYWFLRGYRCFLSMRLR